MRELQFTESEVLQGKNIIDLEEDGCYFVKHVAIDGNTVFLTADFDHKTYSITANLSTTDFEGVEVVEEVAWLTAGDICQLAWDEIQILEVIK